MALLSLSEKWPTIKIHHNFILLCILIKFLKIYFRLQVLRKKYAADDDQKYFFREAISLLENQLDEHHTLAIAEIEKDLKEYFITEVSTEKNFYLCFVAL